jgi:ribonuclease VapC
LGLSLGDRACLALAIEQQATALTADKAWAQLKTGISIQLIR